MANRFAKRYENTDFDTQSEQDKAYAALAQLPGKKGAAPRTYSRVSHNDISSFEKEFNNFITMINNMEPTVVEQVVEEKIEPEVTVAPEIVEPVVIAEPIVETPVTTSKRSKKRQVIEEDVQTIEEIEQ